jgi:hypothetical protein
MISPASDCCRALIWPSTSTDGGEGGVLFHKLPARLTFSTNIQWVVDQYEMCGEMEGTCGIGVNGRKSPTSSACACCLGASTTRFEGKSSTSTFLQSSDFNYSTDTAVLCYGRAVYCLVHSVLHSISTTFHESSCTSTLSRLQNHSSFRETRGRCLSIGAHRRQIETGSGSCRPSRLHWGTSSPRSRPWGAGILLELYVPSKTVLTHPQQVLRWPEWLQP